jgi:hypothetical protein
MKEKRHQIVVKELMNLRFCRVPSHVPTVVANVSWNDDAWLLRVRS